MKTLDIFDLEDDLDKGLGDFNCFLEDGSIEEVCAWLLYVMISNLHNCIVCDNGVGSVMLVFVLLFMH